MKISNVYIGGWFQRTMLQLTEIYDFLRSCDTKLDLLDKEKLKELHKSLQIGKIEYGVDGEEYLSFTTALNLKVKIFEDGLITVNNTNVSEDTLFSDIDKVQDYYENKLSPAFNYLFSLGAPVPKELAHVETIYPYFVICEDATHDDILKVLSSKDNQKYFEFECSKYDVIRGDKYYFINNKKQTLEDIEKYIEQQIFIREFKGQLHRYLNIHRIIWEKIDLVKEKKNVKGSEIVSFMTKLEEYSKTVNLIDGRINQMATYISTREKIAKSDDELTEFLAISGYRYETLRDTLNYIQYLWDMTQTYLSSAKATIKDVKSDVTDSSISNLTIVTSMGVGASLLGLIDSTSWPSVSFFGVSYFFILAAIGFIVDKLMAFIKEKRKYEISDLDYDEDIK
jgi:hypothetical protein